MPVSSSTFFDLSYHFKDTTYGGTHSSQEFVNYLFAGTGWVVTCDFTETANYKIRFKEHHPMCKSNMRCLQL